MNVGSMDVRIIVLCFFFFQAEDGIRDLTVTGVQTCALPIFWGVHLAVAALLLLLQFVLPPFHHGMLARIMVLASYAIGYNLLLGYTGLMSLGHAMFFAAGIYGTGLTVYYLGFGALPAIVIGLLTSIAVALVIGWITLRTTGVSFLIVTMMFAQAFFLATLYFNRITGGDQGLVLAGRLPPLHLGPLTLNLAQPGVKYNRSEEHTSELQSQSNLVCRLLLEKKK